MDQTGMDASLHLQGGLKCQLCDDMVPPVASPPVWMHFNIGAGVRYYAVRLLCVNLQNMFCWVHCTRWETVQNASFTVHGDLIKHQRTHIRLTALFPGLPGWASTRKVKPIWILLKRETVSGSDISWAICKSATRSRQTTMPAPHRSVFYRPDAFLPHNQQRQSTEGNRLTMLFK